ncbi:MAG TPA: LOG family protein [Armatimonadota bacterium]|nr:LOG family protein [Armatimonadota bacterium]
MPVNEERLTREDQLRIARDRLKSIVDEYIQTEAEVRALEQGTFRVVIFGSARIKPNDVVYQKVYTIAHALAERGIDIVTGGGPGLMEAANSGVLDVVERESRSYGLPIDIPTINEPSNKHLDIKSSHRRFTSRLDEFMRLSNAVVVAPGGIGTMLEFIYVWQLLQVGLTNDRPVILFGKEVWSGLLKWMREVLLKHQYISTSDFRWITLVDTEQEVIDLLTVAHERFMYSQIGKKIPEKDVDQIVTAEVLSAVPTELTEEGT